MFNLPAGLGLSKPFVVLSNLYTWGAAVSGALGNGTSTPNVSSPIHIGALFDWGRVKAGTKFNSTVKTDGTLWTWGINGSGQLGDGTTTNHSSPVHIGVATNWGTNLSAGDSHTMLIKSDHTLWGWGEGDHGELGNGVAANISSPVQIGTSSWTAVSAGVGHTLMILANGTLWATGDNVNGQLGDGTKVDKSSPVQIGASSWIAVAAGNNHSLGIKLDGTLWAWGLNTSGQLGDGSTTSTSSPIAVGASSWTFVAAGNLYSEAIRSDGTLWAFGANGNGILGDGTATSRSSPVAIGSSSWTFVATSRTGAHTVAIRLDNTLWAWGFNSSGQLGDNTTTTRSSPVQVSSLGATVAYADAGQSHSIAIANI